VADSCQEDNEPSGTIQCRVTSWATVSFSRVAFCNGIT